MCLNMYIHTRLGWGVQFEVRVWAEEVRVWAESGAGGVCVESGTGGGCVESGIGDGCC